MHCTVFLEIDAMVFVQFLSRVCKAICHYLTCPKGCCRFPSFPHQKSHYTSMQRDFVHFLNRKKEVTVSITRGATWGLTSSSFSSAKLSCNENSISGQLCKPWDASLDCVVHLVARGSRQAKVDGRRREQFQPCCFFTKFLARSHFHAWLTRVIVTVKAPVWRKYVDENIVPALLC